MKEYIFQGEWESELELTNFKEFRNAKGSYTSLIQNSNDGILKLYIEDILDDNPDPTKPQINTINYILNNQQTIIQSILEKVNSDYSRLQNIYGYEGSEKDEFMPDLNTAIDIKRLIGFGNIHVSRFSKDGYAYYGLEGGCTWDDEHGIGLILNRDEVIEFGSADEAFSFYPKVLKHNGEYEIFKKEQESRDIRKVMPRKYNPSQKYGKLKPKQYSANESYEYDLITRNFNDELIKQIEKGTIDKNHKSESWNDNLIEWAAWRKNNEVLKYLVKENADTRYAIHRCTENNTNFEGLKILIESGIDIDQVNAIGENIFSHQLLKYATLLDVKNKWEKSGDFSNSEDMNLKMNKVDQVLQYCIKNGTNKYLENTYGFDPIKKLRHLNDETIAEVKKRYYEIKSNKWNFWKK